MPPREATSLSGSKPFAFNKLAEDGMKRGGGGILLSAYVVDIKEHTF